MEAVLHDQELPPFLVTAKGQVTGEGFVTGRVKYRSLVPDKLVPARPLARKTDVKLLTVEKDSIGRRSSTAD